MRRTVPFLAAIVLMASCAGAPEQEAKVMARFVPERFDDFIFENNLIAGRIYGEALESCGEGQLTSPGVDVWVKTPGALVANQRYKDELENGKTYHKDWGNGKDCYKVGRTLGAGASAAIIGNRLIYPATNYRSWKIIEEGPEKIVFSLSYPEWEAGGEKISLVKKITVSADTYFTKVEDIYTFSGEFGDSLEVAAGIFRHPEQETIEEERFRTGSYAIWEHASDQSVEPEDGMLGIAVIVPGATGSRYSSGDDHGLVCRTVKSGEPFTYYFGSCWSKGNIKTADAWFKELDGFEGKL